MLHLTNKTLAEEPKRVVTICADTEGNLWYLFFNGWRQRGGDVVTSEVTTDNDQLSSQLRTGLAEDQLRYSLIEEKAKQLRCELESERCQVWAERLNYDDKAPLMLNRATLKQYYLGLTAFN